MRRANRKKTALSPVCWTPLLDSGTLPNPPGALGNISHDHYETRPFLCRKLSHRLQNTSMNFIAIGPPKTYDEHAMMRCRTVPCDPLICGAPLPSPGPEVKRAIAEAIDSLGPVDAEA